MKGLGWIFQDFGCLKRCLRGPSGCGGSGESGASKIYSLWRIMSSFLHFLFCGHRRVAEASAVWVMSTETLAAAAVSAAKVETSKEMGERRDPAYAPARAESNRRTDGRASPSKPWLASVPTSQVFTRNDP